MSKDIIFKCGICEADFRPGALDKDGKCVSCAKEYPTVKNKMEAMALNQPEVNLGRKLDEATVRQIIKEELNEFKAELKAEKSAEQICKEMIGRFREELKAKAKAEAMAHARAAKEGKTVEDNGGNE